MTLSGFLLGTLAVVAPAEEGDVVAVVVDDVVDRAVIIKDIEDIEC
jgi:hypothetical protein